MSKGKGSQGGKMGGSKMGGGGGRRVGRGREKIRISGEVLQTTLEFWNKFSNKHCGRSLASFT